MLLRLQCYLFSSRHSRSSSRETTENMRTFFYTAGVLASVTMILIVIASEVLIPSLGASYDRSSKEFVDTVIPLIVLKGKNELLKRASPELKAQVTESELDKVFGMFPVLGSLIKYEGSEGYSTISVGNKSTTDATGGPEVFAKYLAKATFANGTANFRVLLIRRGGKWLIHGFHVSATKTSAAEQGT